jgi:hypothetical protein
MLGKKKIVMIINLKHNNLKTKIPLVKLKG